MLMLSLCRRREAAAELLEEWLEGGGGMAKMGLATAAAAAFL